MKKLMELFKTYEHVLSEDSVVEHFRNIITKVLKYNLCLHFLLYFVAGTTFNCFCFSYFEQSKKFAKPELKACVEEFEDKLHKFHMEKKEQEVTARNAQIHQRKIDNIEDFSVTANPKEEGSESPTGEEGRCHSQFCYCLIPVALWFYILTLLGLDFDLSSKLE